MSGISEANRPLPFYYTKKSYWGAPWYSPGLVQLLTIFPLTGFFGADHLFLRSPTTAVAKALTNCCSLGLWYFYDIIQMTVDKEEVQKNGLSIPFYGPAGIGAGMFIGGQQQGQNKTPGKSPWLFICFTLLTLLPFGLDFLFAGDTVGAGLRLFTLINPFLWIFGFIWGCYNMWRAWMTPGDVLDRGVARVWPLTYFVSQFADVSNTLGPGNKTALPACRNKGILETIMTPINTVVGIATDTFVEPIKQTLQGVAELPQAVAVPLRAAVEEGLAPSITAGLKVGRMAQQATQELPRLTANITDRLATVATAAAVNPAVALTKQIGGAIGSQDDLLLSDAALLFTLFILGTGGIILSLVRARNVGSSSKTTRPNDAPPQPRTV